MARSSTDVASVGDVRKVVKLIQTLYKRLDDRVGDAFEAIRKGDDDQAEFWNEHEEKIKKLNRAVNRLVDKVAELERRDHSK